MRSRFPLYAKILLWFFLNVLVLGIAAWWVSGERFLPSLDSLVAGRSGDHIQAVTDDISKEIRNSPPEKWNAILARYESEHHVRFYLFNNTGKQLAGDPVDLPAPVHQRLIERPAPLPGEGPARNGPPSRDRPPPPPDAPPDEPPPFDSTGNPPPGANPPPDAPPLQRGHIRYMLHTGKPSLYWVVVRIPGVRAQPGSRPDPASIITVAETLSAGGLFFDPMRWLELGAAAILLSALLWLPLVRGITRSVSQMTAAAGMLAEGRFDVRVDDSRRDELGALGVAINRMAARLAGFVGGQKRFLGDIAHELCSPLARAQMALGILEQRGDETQLAYITDVREEIELMSNLVNELLTFSKAALGAQIKLQPVALLPIVEKAAHRESSADTAVQIDVAEDLRVMAEPELLLRSLANLVRNGIHYAGHAGPISISATRQDDKVVLKVADSGPGVPPEALAQVFDPFYRVDPSRARETGGVGLGLAIVKTCVESCGGVVMARNGLPGLVITITLQGAA